MAPGGSMDVSLPVDGLVVMKKLNVKHRTITNSTQKFAWSHCRFGRGKERGRNLKNPAGVVTSHCKKKKFAFAMKLFFRRCEM